MLVFLVELLGSWAEVRLGRLGPRAIRVLNAVFVVVCAAATGAFVLVLLAVAM